MDFVSFKLDFLLKYLFRDNMGEKSDEERAQQIYENSVETEQEIADILTGK
jgi:hypothetical protein